MSVWMYNYYMSYDKAIYIYVHNSKLTTAETQYKDTEE
jgi:hypothetical protein